MALDLPPKVEKNLKMYSPFRSELYLIRLLDFTWVIPFPLNT